jgi:hypothetical protein
MQDSQRRLPLLWPAHRARNTASIGSYYNTVTPGYGYGGVYRPGYRAARRVAIHRARWH